MQRIRYILVFCTLALPVLAQKPIRPQGEAGRPMPNITGRWMADSSISMSASGPRRDVNLDYTYIFNADSTVLVAKGNEDPKAIGTYGLTRDGGKTFITFYRDGKPTTIKMELQGVTNNYMAIYSNYPQATSTQYFTRLDKR